MRGFAIGLAIGVGLLLALPAHAFVPHTGDRAAPLSGRDLRTDSELRLEELRGKWVLVDFFHMQCPSCLRDLPEVCVAAKPYLESGELDIVLVSLDGSRRAGELKRFITSLPEEPHVIYSGKLAVDIGPPELLVRTWDSYAPQATEWGISGVPSSYLITPDGTIAAKRIRRDNAADMFEYFLTRESTTPPVALRTSASAGDNSEVTLFIEAASTSHQPLLARVLYRLKHNEYKEFEGCTLENRSTTVYTDWVEHGICFEFFEFSDVSVPISIDASGAQGVQYRVELMLPGSESTQDGKGLWIRQFGELDFTLDWLCKESSL